MTCPICKRPTVAKTRPFCSQRCADIDLGKWLTGSYVIPDSAIDTSDDDSDMDAQFDGGAIH